MRELPVPNVLHDASDAVELARVWVGLGDLHVSLNVGMYGGAEGPGEETAWGDILADLTRHVAHAIAARSDKSEAELRRALLARLEESLASDDPPYAGEYDATD